MFSFLAMYSNNNPNCDKCGERPYYTNDGTNYPRRCETHKLPDDTNVVEKRCIKCYLEYYLNVNDLCNNCNDWFVKKVHKSKETHIKDVLDANNIKYTSSDKPVDISSCSKRRPDFLIDKGTFFIVLEVDENQHKSRACECEQIRMIQIHQDIGMNTVFIRYNPDNYINNLNEKITYDNGREKDLLDLLKGLHNRITVDDPLSAYYIAYDGYNGIPQKFKIDY